MTNAFEIRRKKDQMKSYVAPDRKNHTCGSGRGISAGGGGEGVEEKWRGWDGGSESGAGMRGEARAAGGGPTPGARAGGWGGKKYRAMGGGTEGRRAG